MKRLLLLAIALITFSFPALAVIELYEFDTPEQEQQFKELSNTLRCPKCQNNTIGDSNAELAQDLRQKVYEMTKDGQTKQDIVDYMIARYGNFVTYKPPFTMGTAILWFGPAFVIVIGVSFILVRSRKRPVAKNKTDWDTDKEQRVAELLNEDNGDKQ
jgi:cytochrome c-type biogenesis protein CcmH